MKLRKESRKTLQLPLIPHQLVWTRITGKLKQAMHKSHSICKLDRVIRYLCYVLNVPVVSVAALIFLDPPRSYSRWLFSRSTTKPGSSCVAHILHVLPSWQRLPKNARLGW